MILAIQNDRLIFFLNHENVDRRYDFKAGKIKKVQSCFFLKIILKMRRRQQLMLFSFEEIS